MNAPKNTEVVAADQETEDITAVIEDQHTVEEMAGTDSEIEETEDQDPEAMTRETNTTEEEEIPEIEAHQEVAVTEDRDQEEATTGIAEDPMTLTADLLLGPTTAKVDPQGPEVKELDQIKSSTPDREAASLTASTVIAEVAIHTLKSTMKTAAEEQDLTVLVKRPIEDKVVTAEVPLTESTMTTTSTVETTTAVNSEERNKSSQREQM